MRAGKQASKRLGGGGGGGGSSSGGGGKAGGKGAVVTLSDANFDAKVLGDAAFWMVEFFAPWCGHCKALAPEWAKAAGELAPRGVKLGAVDCTANEALCAKYGVRGYPTILSFGRDKQKHAPYEGARTADGIIAFASGKAATEGPPPEVPQLTSAAAFDAACAGRQACVLAFLPHILDATAAGRNRSLAVLRTGAAAFASRPWGFAWSEGGAQAALESALGVGGAGYPAVAMLNANKGVASVMRASLSEGNLKEFLNLLPSPSPVTLPAPSGGVVAAAPWDGKDAAPPALEEDEFDLSDLEL
jgi:protein disulfide-isomerase A6